MSKKVNMPFLIKVECFLHFLLLNKTMLFCEWKLPVLICEAKEKLRND